MKLAVITLNRHSLKVASEIQKHFCCDIYIPEKLAQGELLPLTGGLSHHIPRILKEYDGSVFIMSLGIVVRMISSSMGHKSSDPPVLCVSPDGRYIIPVLSGHLGGANELARDLAVKTGGEAVITTASDLFQKKAVDMIAKEHGFVIDSFPRAMEITSLMIDDKEVDIVSDRDGPSPEGTIPYSKWHNPRAEGAVFISYRTGISLPVPAARLIPPVLILGAGCRKGVPFEKIRDFAERLFREHQLDLRALKAVGSIDLKKEEPGLVQLAEEFKVPFLTWPSYELDRVSEDFEQSEFVRKITGTGAVSMPSGFLASGRGTCLVPKRAEEGITLSVWEEKI